MSHQTYQIAQPEAGQTLLQWLGGKLRRPQQELLRLLEARRVTINGSPAHDPKQRLRVGQRVEVRPFSAEGSKSANKATERRPKDAPLPRSAIVHRDAEILIVNKPPGLTTMRHEHESREFGARARKYLPPTLADLLPPLLREAEPNRPPVVRAVHRLDRDTSGLVIFARTIAAEQHLGLQFRAHTIGRVYLALVRGEAQDARIESHLVDDRGDNRRGSSTNGEGQRAITHVRVVERLSGYTLVECRLETGRTHQVRIHLGEAGTPLCGEQIYDRPLHGRPHPDGSKAPRILLHAQSLAIDHPRTGERLSWECPMPEDFLAIMRRLR